MKNNFRDAYINLFENSFTNLRRIIRIKLKAIMYSNKYINQTTSNGEYPFKKKQLTQQEFEPLDLIEIEALSSDSDDTFKSSDTDSLSSDKSDMY